MSICTKVEPSNLFRLLRKEVDEIGILDAFVNEANLTAVEGRVNDFLHLLIMIINKYKILFIKLIISRMFQNILKIKNPTNGGVCVL